MLILSPVYLATELCRIIWICSLQYCSTKQVTGLVLRCCREHIQMIRYNEDAINKRNDEVARHPLGCDWMQVSAR